MQVCALEDPALLPPIPRGRHRPACPRRGATSQVASSRLRPCPPPRLERAPTLSTVPAPLPRRSTACPLLAPVSGRSWCVAVSGPHISDPNAPQRRDGRWASGLPAPCWEAPGWAGLWGQEAGRGREPCLVSGGGSASLGGRRGPGLAGGPGLTASSVLAVSLRVLEGGRAGPLVPAFGFRCLDLSPSGDEVGKALDPTWLTAWFEAQTRQLKRRWLVYRRAPEPKLEETGLRLGRPLGVLSLPTPASTLTLLGKLKEKMKAFPSTSRLLQRPLPFSGTCQAVPCTTLATVELGSPCP